ncbi:hypothetical protein CFAM422_002976 [Trichoderma lentiforme]|uniref:Uncharacterized protein n=1 Tax=Trichoderma lentiforme TaxID=1567552 RepID=A0A9P5CHR1_9HYPO|nr:hypothetical protein CFAM422_002976 [Trichoderma lentiforme]
MRERRRTWKLLCKIRPIEIDRRAAEEHLNHYHHLCFVQSSLCQHWEADSRDLPAQHREFTSPQPGPKQTEQGLDSFNGLCSYSDTDARAGLVCSNAAMSQTCASRCRHISPV